MALTGTTGTGLDRIISVIGADYGLNNRIAGSQLRGGAAAADAMNGIIVSGIKALGLANDGEITTSDVYALNNYVRTKALVQWTVLHGDDEDGLETGFHQVQNDGAVTRMFGQNAVDTVFDGIYHLGFEVKWGRFVNEDGNGNAAVSDVATWLNSLLAPELAAGTLANGKVDPQFHGTTGTGLDGLVETIVDDKGLNYELSQTQINAGAAAADAMNKIIVEGIRATGIADDGDITEMDVYDLHNWVVAHHSAEMMTLHGDDEDGVETGFHVVQNDGSRSYLFGEDAVDTIADGIYHIGFDTVWGRFENEDGNANVRVADVADWLTVLLRNDLASGNLSSGRGAVDPATIAGDIVFQRAAPVSDDGSSGATDLGTLPATKLANGTITLDFKLNSPDDGGYHVLFSKDGASNADGDITVFSYNSEIEVLIQDGSGDHWLSTEGFDLQAGQQYSLALSFGQEGLQLYIDGEKLAADFDVHTGLYNNTRSLVLDGGTWGRNATYPTAIWNHLDGEISNFKVYDRALDSFEVAGLNNSGALPADWQGIAVRDGDQPAVYKGTGLIGEVFDQSARFNSIQDLIAKSVTSTPTQRFTASEINFGGFHESKTLKEFLGDSGKMTSGNGGAAMTTIGMHLTGYVYIPEGHHLITVQSDDGFLLQLGGDTVLSYAWDHGMESESKSVEVSGGLYAVNLYYYENSGREGLRFQIDGKTVGADAFFKTVEDYDTALANKGAMPVGGLPEVYDGPVGTTGTALDSLVRLIGEDEGLANNVSAQQIRMGAAAADKINHMIVDAITEMGLLDDGKLTVSEVYDISDWIKANHYEEFVAAHGDDESGVETGFHLVQNDGGTTLMFGEDAVNTILDSIYHIGFDTMWDRFLNEDGNVNARVEDVTYWLNQIFATEPLPAAGSGPSGGAGSAAAPDVIVTNALNTTLAPGALTLTLKGTAVNGTGNGLANVLTGNAYANQLDGYDGNDQLNGMGGNDVLIGGRGADTMTGGYGNDSFFVDNSGDQVIENAGQGIDTVVSTIGYTLAGPVENLVLIGGANASGTGNASANMIEGNDGANRLSGAAGDDKLFGNAGADTLIGGSGADKLVGGAGADSFRFESAADSTVATSGRDVICDFSAADGDKIDLRAIDAVAGGTDNAFVFTSAFHGVAGELTVSSNGSGWLVQADINGDSSADFALLVTSPTALVATDFLL